MAFWWKASSTFEPIRMRGWVPRTSVEQAQPLGPLQQHLHRGGCQLVRPRGVRSRIASSLVQIA